MDVKLSSRSPEGIKYLTIYLSTASSLDHGKNYYLSLRSPVSSWNISIKLKKTSKPLKKKKKRYWKNVLSPSSANSEDNRTLVYQNLEAWKGAQFWKHDSRKVKVQKLSSLQHTMPYFGILSWISREKPLNCIKIIEFTGQLWLTTEVHLRNKKVQLYSGCYTPSHLWSALHFLWNGM